MLHLTWRPHSRGPSRNSRRLARRAGKSSAQSLGNQVAARAVALFRMGFQIGFDGGKCRCLRVTYRLRIAFGDAEHAAIPPAPDIVNVGKRDLPGRRPFHQAEQFFAVILGNCKAG